MTIQPHTVTTNPESLSDPQRSLPEVLQGLMWVRICMDASKKKKEKKKGSTIQTAPCVVFICAT